jgi:hypothetical protein
MQIERETEIGRPKMQKKKKKKMVPAKMMVFEVNPAFSHDLQHTVIWGRRAGG